MDNVKIQTFFTVLSIKIKMKGVLLNVFGPIITLLRTNIKFL